MTAIADGRPQGRDGTARALPTSAVPERQSPTTWLIDQLTNHMGRRQAWLIAAGERARKMNEESKGDTQ